MSIGERYPFQHHPCWSIRDRWERIHLPVARKCNVKCIYCDHRLGSNCHSGIRPGISRSLMSPEEATKRCINELSRRGNLRIVAVSGPGEPLANKETFRTLETIRGFQPNIKICLSTNGTLLSSCVSKLVELNVETVSVTMSSVKESSIEKIYEWIVIKGKRITGSDMASHILESQLSGISDASEAGILIKVNTILIPEINGNEILDLSRQIRKHGAKLQNIVPLIPWDSATRYRSPTQEELDKTRNETSSFIPQFLHCKQCRSDVVGVPGQDEIL
ncbi:MAG: radical SAM protein [Candidatus Lokiarchaeota archaeon]|nr:radical SAM protein [Candidatus Lokiarchaeota archaeon]